MTGEVLVGVGEAVFSEGEFSLPAGSAVIYRVAIDLGTWKYWERVLASGRKNGMLIGMSITITLGKSGRLVVPKAIRDSLGLREGTRLKLNVQGGRIEAVPEADEVTIDQVDGLSVIRGTPALGKGAIVDAIKGEREARDERIVARSRSEKE